MAKKRRTAHAKAEPTVVFQFKITLLEIEPAIWRRIQVVDCTLDQLHEHIQTAMGWTNSHLHEFEISGTRYGDPDLLEDDFGEADFEDSLEVLLSEVLDRRRRGFRFRYVYDFGDSWEHEILLEDRLAGDPKVKYPVCVAGERACPPEDCGGTWGYENLLAILADPKHEEHEEYSEWAGDFDPEAFSPAAAMREMHAGLPDWRSAEFE